MVVFDPSHPEFASNPYKLYARLCRENPVHYCPIGCWVLSSYAAVSRALKDTDLSSQPRSLSGRGRGTPSPAGRVRESLLPYLDPPAHTHMRALVREAFSPDLAAQLRTPVREMACDLVRKAAGAGGMDLVADLATPLFGRLVSDLMGFPAEDGEALLRQAAVLRNMLDPLATREVQQEVDQAIAAFKDYAAVLLRRRRTAPGKDVLSLLSQVEEKGRRLSDVDVAAQAMLLFTAGLENSTAMLATSVHALLGFPEVMVRLRDDFSLIPAAVEELLRLAGIAQGTVRVSNRDITFGSHRIPRGELIMLLLAAANRDPAQFPDPDRIDLTRAWTGHVAFGGGVHHCMGAALVRMQNSVILEVLLEKLPRLALADRVPQWRTSLISRALTSLPVTF